MYMNQRKLVLKKKKTSKSCVCVCVCTLGLGQDVVNVHVIGDVPGDQKKPSDFLELEL